MLARKSNHVKIALENLEKSVQLVMATAKPVAYPSSRMSIGGVSAYPSEDRMHRRKRTLHSVRPSAPPSALLGKTMRDERSMCESLGHTSFRKENRAHPQPGGSRYRMSSAASEEGHWSSMRKEGDDRYPKIRQESFDESYSVRYETIADQSAEINKEQLECCRNR